MNANQLRNATLGERIIALETETAQCKHDRADLEHRMRKVERTIWQATGALAVLQLLLKYLA